MCPAYLLGTNIKFSSLSTSDGLSQSDVTCLLQDSKGFMWFGTEYGLNRYDGFEFTVFKHNLQDPNSLTNNFVHTLFEDKDGTLWIGTESGLNFFHRDVQELKTFQHSNGNLGFMNHNAVWSVYEDKNNEIWIGSEKGLEKFNKEKGIFYTIQIPFANDDSKYHKIRHLLEDRYGMIWIATEGNGVLTYNKSTGVTSQFLAKEGISGISSDNVWCLFEDEEGRIWMGTDKGIDIYNPFEETYQHLYNNTINRKYRSNNIRKIFQDREKNIWVATLGGGLFKFNAKERILEHFETDTKDPNSLSDDKIYALCEDKMGSLWVGTSGGVNRFDKIQKNFEYYFRQKQSNALSSNNILSISGDSINTYWIGTDQGLDYFDKNTLKYTNYGLPVNSRKNVNTIYSDLSGLLLGTDEGILRFNTKTKKFEKFGPGSIEDELNTRIIKIVKDGRDRFWIATEEGVYYLDKNGPTMYSISSITKSNRLPSNDIRDILVDNQGVIWIGTGGGLCKLSYLDEKSNKFEIEIFEKRPNEINCLSNNSITCLFINKNHELWIGTYGGGLNKYIAGRDTFYHYTEKDGLPNNIINGVLEDKYGNTWVSTNNGLAQLNVSDITFRSYQESDGLQGSKFNPRSCYRSPLTEEFLFGGENGLNTFFPEKVKRNNTPPFIVLTDFMIYNKHVEVNVKGSPLKKHISQLNTIELDYTQNVISFGFVALHYSSSKKNQHAYKMEGYDEDWVYIGNNRRANYNLEPGEYTFLVKGANSDGVWSRPLALKIIVTPPIWRKWWFISIVILAIIVAIFLVYRYRVNRIEAQKEMLEVQVMERTAEVMRQKEKIEQQKHLLEIEKGKVDKLLLNILPEETVQELTTKGKATARKYRMGTVMFTDFKGFTKIAESLKPEELVEELDSYFGRFDEIIDKYNVEKIKTIGDAYMCAGGIPIRNKSNPIDVILAGLEIQEFMAETKKEKEAKGEEFWEIRIGINTGNLIAGVIGTKRFAYDIWGDTVNIASRMESSSEPGRVNISGETHKLVREFFNCTYRGKIPAKNKGEIEMYFVDGIRAELSIDGKGRRPNKTFWSYVDLHLYSNIKFRKLESYIIEKLQTELPKNLHYHSIHHTLDVYKATEKIALLEGITGDNLFLLKTAALYHDAGFIEKNHDNEVIAAKMAKEDLSEYGYTDEQIETVCELIMSTQVPQQPKNNLEEIICDADLEYLGRSDFHEIADKLKLELIDRGSVKDDKDWDEQQIAFISKHHYFTKSAKKLREKTKQENLEELKIRLSNYSA